MGEQMGLDGAVWNTRDGEVEVIAAHQSGSVLAEFEARLWKGPGRVDNVSRIDASPYAIDPGFVILPTR